MSKVKEVAYNIYLFILIKYLVLTLQFAHTPLTIKIYLCINIKSVAVTSHNGIVMLLLLI